MYNLNIKNENLLLILLLILIFFSCSYQNEAEKDIANRNINKIEFYRHLFNSKNTQSQRFVINGNKDTLLSCQNGTRLKIYKNSFIDSSGNIIKDSINLEVKEAFGKIDFVLNNLTTISGGQILESDGMIYISTEYKGKSLSLSKPIKCIINRDKINSFMSIYQGELSDSSINWINSEPTENEQLKLLIQESRHYYTFIEGNYNDSVKFYSNYNNWLFSRKRKVGDDTLIDNVKIKFTDLKFDTIKITKSPNGVLMQEVFSNKGNNDYIEDLNTNYIFSIKKLGWANIDRLYSNPKTENVDLVVKANNGSEFDYIFISMIFNNQNIYLPGYQKKDNTYGFSHYDNEKPKLPIGEEVTILATAYKKDRPFFDMKKIKIQKQQIINLTLRETSMENLKRQLEAKL